MKEFKLAMVQKRITGQDIEANTKLAVEYIREAKRNGADFVLFPECFLTSYGAPKICSLLRPVEEISQDPGFVRWCGEALSDDSKYLSAIRRAARESAVGVEITAFTRGEKYPQNTAYIIGRDGSVLLKYSKVHTCAFDWERYLEAGKEFKVCEFDGICLGTMICYDREYPESARELSLLGAELILVPNDCDHMKPYRLRELSVEAMQNMVGIAMANPPGKEAGCSSAFVPMVWDYEDNLLVEAKENYEGLVYAVFDMEAVRAWRREEDLGKYRRPGAYRHLTQEAWREAASPEKVVVELLIAKGWHISFAESCTGGLAAARLVSVPDASRVLDASFVTYANEAKVSCLGVLPESIRQYGVVSESVAEEMARGVADKNQAQVGVGITGIAGPGGGTVKKPVGMVCFGFYIDGKVHVYTKQFGDLGRNIVREKSVEFVYDTLVKLLGG